MSEAVVNFTDGFRKTDCESNISAQPDFDYRYITSTNTKEVVLVVEGGEFLIGASFNKKNCTAKDYFLHLPTINSLLFNAYNAYKLHYGYFSNRFRAESNEFKEIMDRFFTPFLHLYRVNKIPLVDLFNGVDFLSIDNVNFLEIDCLVANCINEFHCIKNGLFFYQERLVQFSVAKKDLPTLCRFVIHTLIPSAVQNEVSPSPSIAFRRVSIKSARNGFFVDGSMLVDYHGELSEHFFPKVFLRDSDAENPSLTAYELVAYRVRSATACFLVYENEMSEDEFAHFTERLADFIDEKIAKITSRMGVDVPLLPHSDIPYHFIYFNPDSLSLRKSFPSYAIPNQNSSSSTQIPPLNMHRLAFETYDRFAANTCEFAQLYLKADNDWWLVFKRIERRILVLFILQTVTTSIVDIEFYVENIVNSAPFKILFFP
ncbi:hypothetical protein niasHT_036381 [Heterodera trifolii]|uniref:CCZ1/INTU second Longin domain-containing protein n=1 Tax=Heterodera trifolii TaxID=157864 RepID=A0ABD2IJT7_9BILA